MKKERVVNLSKEIVSFYQHLFTLEPLARHIILHSGRSVTKSTFYSVWDLFRLLYLPNADIMVLAYEYSSIKDKVFSDYKFAAREILHIPEDRIEFHETENGTLWIKIKNKYGTNKIWFEHAKGGAEALKGFRPTSNNKWINVRWYELTNFINWNPQEVANTIATFIRNAYGNVKWDNVKKYCQENKIHLVEDVNWLNEQTWYSKNWEMFLSREFCVTYEFNTPSTGITGGGWVLDWLENKRKSDNVYYQFNTYLDMTTPEQFKFIKPEMLQEIENLKNTDPITYNHIYLGKMPYDGDLCFPTLNKQTHYGQHENFEPDLLVIGIDVGRSDATVCTLNGYEFRDKDIRIAAGMNVWYHSNRKAEFYKDNVRCKYEPFDLFKYSNMILEFLDMVHEKYPYSYVYFQMDYANEGKAYYDQLFRYGAPTWLSVNKSWEKVIPETRIDFLNVCLSVPGLFKFYDLKTYEAYKNQVYGKMGPNGERKRLDDPTKKTLDMDRQDSMEYAIIDKLYKPFMDRIKSNLGKFKK